MDGTRDGTVGHGGPVAEASTRIASDVERFLDAPAPELFGPV